jgi:tetratricopeptide (TPR) repeat protein
MLRSSNDDRTLSRRYALCVGIGTYTNLINRNLRYAVADATTIAERLAQRGNFAVTLLTEATQTTKAALDEAVKELLSAPGRQSEDLILLYFSCHGDINAADNTFCLLPSNAIQQAEGMFEPTMLIGIDDFARWFENARAHNIVVLLDVCHSGGAGAALQHFKLDLAAGPNFFFIGAARQDQVTMQSSMLQHGVFTHCLLRACEQPPTEDGWLTISQIHTFISHEISWFAKDRPTQIQSWSVSVNPNLPLLRNPGYPELCPLPPLWNVPLQRNLFFTGQEDVLSQLASILQSEQKTALTQPHALSGLGGIGKTQLALEYAYRHRQDYHAVLWGPADTREALISTFVTIASLLDLPEKDEKDQMVIVEAVKTWLADRSQWLLILDNADELALVKEFLPPAFRGHLLITTRAQAMGKLARKLEMKVMLPEIGALLLLRRSGRLATVAALEKASSVEILQATELSQELGGLPLALDQAGAYIEETQCLLTEYRDLYRTQRAKLLRKRGGLMDDHPEAVATTWNISFERVEAINPAAADLLRLCAFLAPDAIPEEILTESTEELGPVLAPVAADALLLNDAIAILRAYSLIARDPHARTLTVHRLVQAVLRDSLPTETQQHWMQRAVNAVAAAYPGQDFTNWPTLERLLPHALTCATWITQASLATLKASVLLNEAGYYLYERARYAEAEPLLKRALAIREQGLRAMHPDTANSLNNLAGLYRAQGKYGQAEPLYQRALAIREQQLGPEHPDTAHSLNNLAVLYDVQGKYEEAEPLYQRALVIWEQELGASHPDTATGLNNLAGLYDAQGKYAEAEPLLERALAIREQELGASHPDTATGLNSLAALYNHQGKYREAEPLYQRALAICENILGRDHPTTQSLRENYTFLLRNMGRDAEAKQLEEGS